jgi:hypothetical protein
MCCSRQQVPLNLGRLPITAAHSSRCVRGYLGGSGLGFLGARGGFPPDRLGPGQVLWNAFRRIGVRRANSPDSSLTCCSVHCSNAARIFSAGNSGCPTAATLSPVARYTTFAGQRRRGPERRRVTHSPAVFYSYASTSICREQCGVSIMTAKNKCKRPTIPRQTANSSIEVFCARQIEPR